MKFRVTFKSPDAVSETIRSLGEEFNIPKQSTATMMGDIPDMQEFADSVNIFVSKWVRSGEYITVEFDTDANTCTVVPR